MADAELSIDLDRPLGVTEGAFVGFHRVKATPKRPRSVSRSQYSGSSVTRPQPPNSVLEHDPLIVMHDDVSEAIPDPGKQHRVLPKNASEDLEKIFKIIVQRGQAGAASLLAERVRGSCKPEFRRATSRGSKDVVESVWQFYETKGSLWISMPFSEWALYAHDITFEVFDPILAAVQTHYENAQVQLRQIKNGIEDGDEDAAKAFAASWKAAHSSALKAQRDLGSGPAIDSVAKLALTYLRDDAFKSRLDRRRDVLSFQNGVLELRTLTLRPRTVDDYMSFSLPCEYVDDADMSDIQAFISSLMPDEEAKETMHRYLGYFSTGETTQKMFMQVSAPPHSGKTKLFEILSHVLGDYFLFNKINSADIAVGSSFEHDLGLAMLKLPAPRCIAVDETRDGFRVKEEFINNISSGSDVIPLTLRMKGDGSVVINEIMAKIVISSNHSIGVSASAAGTLERIVGMPLTFRFLADYDAENPIPGTKPRDDALIARLKSDAGRGGVLRYLAEGAFKFYQSGITSSAAWDAKACELRIKSDPYFSWIAENYTPTGDTLDTVPMASMVEKYITEHRRSDPKSGLQIALTAMSTYVTFGEWGVPQRYNGGDIPGETVRVVGAIGLRPRKLEDPVFQEAMIQAKAAVAAKRLADRAAHLV